MIKPLPRIGVDQAYYALLTQDNDSGVAYGTPTRMQGVNSISYNPNSQLEVYYADDGAYTSASQDGDIDLTVNVADLDPSVYAEILGVTRGANGVIDEAKTDDPPELAFGYRTQKSNGEYRFIWILKGKFSKPAVEAQTKGNAINFQGTELNFKGLNRDYDGKKRRRVDSDDENIPTGVTAATLNSAVTGWFSDPDYVVVAAGTPLSDVVASTGSGSGEIDLAFTAPSGATAVKAQIRDAAISSEWVDATTAAAITAASTSATITGLTPGNTYSCRLVVTGGASNGISNTDDAAAGA